MRVGILLVVLLACGCASPERATSEWESVILAPRSHGSSEWLPSVQETRELAKALPAFLFRIQTTRSVDLPRIGDYVCVYRGTTSEGQRAITGHFLWRPFLEGAGLLECWRTGDIGVDGGREAQFAVTYLPDAAEFVEFRVGADR